MKVCLSAIVIVMSACLLSCASTRKSAYFIDQQDGVLPTGMQVPETVIGNNDLLGIAVSSLSPQASAVFNAPQVVTTTGNSQTGSNQTSGYLVDADGFIQFPILGKVKASGLTEEQLRISLTKTLSEKKLLVDPIVSVRYLNFKVTVLGEVANPTVIQVPTQKISLLEALGLAGDITVYGKKDNVMILREEGGVRTVKRLNLNSTELFTSPYYYLRSNDVVYVEPNKAKVAGSSRTTQLLPVILSGLSFAAIIIDRVTRNN